jgi:GNAT superfamily N-acetyltransferase
MSDMLVKLYDLPPLIGRYASLANMGDLAIRRALAPEKHRIVQWALETFGDFWASECDVSFSNHPISCFIALRNSEILGFACYDSIYKGFFGPIVVRADARGFGVGAALLIQTLHAMASVGYAYAIVGHVSQQAFFTKSVGATVIEDSTPGAYQGMLPP